nr:uncharacterized protein CTRU02_05595 [Colletotrichum truncatum]KAF6794038.1 hypothetical protein CTRU02_05595 [Colletotrichum truncatum]
MRQLDKSPFTHLDSLFLLHHIMGAAGWWDVLPRDISSAPQLVHKLSGCVLLHDSVTLRPYERMDSSAERSKLQRRSPQRSSSSGAYVMRRSRSQSLHALDPSQNLDSLYRSPSAWSVRFAAKPKERCGLSSAWSDHSDHVLVAGLCDFGMAVALWHPRQMGSFAALMACFGCDEMLVNYFSTMAGCISPKMDAG